MNNQQLDTDDIGFRFYRTEYLPDLLQTKLESIVPWKMIKGELIPAANRFYEQGMFITRALDEEHFGYCYQSLIGVGAEPRSLDIEILMQWDADKQKLVNTVSNGNKLRLLHTAAAIDLFKKDAEANGRVWTPMHNGFVPKIVGKLYEDRLFFVCMDAANSLAITEALKVVFDIDLKVRLHNTAAPA